MPNLSTAELTRKANLIRQDIIRMLLKAGSGHSAGPLGMADIFTALYFNIMNHDPKKPDWAERDRLILSNGHICPARYAAMAHAGYFPREWLWKLRKLDSPLQGHRQLPPQARTVPPRYPRPGSISPGERKAYAARMDG